MFNFCAFFILKWLLSSLKTTFYGKCFYKELKIPYLSNNFIIVNKDYDLKINSDDLNDKFSLHEKLLQEYPTLANKSLKHYFYFVNRLDYSTSGLLCIALNKKACTEASACFEKRSVVKYYLAIVRGHLSVNRMNISLSIGEISENNICGKMSVKLPGVLLNKLRSAITKLVVLERGIFATYPATKVLLMPLTGRRHQLRVHCSYIGHTIVGDYTYSNRKDTKPTRMYLHSFRLIIPCTMEPLDVETEDPFQPSNIRTGWWPVEFINPLNKDTMVLLSNIH